jgi:hypothetical protein
MLRPWSYSALLSSASLPTGVEWKRHDPDRAFGPNNRHEYVTWVTDGGTN